MDKMEQIHAAEAMLATMSYLQERLARRKCGNLGIIMAVYDPDNYKDDNSVCGGTADREDWPEILRKLTKRQEIYNEQNPEEKKGFPGYKVRVS